MEASVPKEGPQEALLVSDDGGRACHPELPLAFTCSNAEDGSREGADDVASTLATLDSSGFPISTSGSNSCALLPDLS